PLSPPSSISADAAPASPACFTSILWKAGVLFPLPLPSPCAGLSPPDPKLPERQPYSISRPSPSNLRHKHIHGSPGSAETGLRYIVDTGSRDEATDYLTPERIEVGHVHCLFPDSHPSVTSSSVSPWCSTSGVQHATSSPPVCRQRRPVAPPLRSPILDRSSASQPFRIIFRILSATRAGPCYRTRVLPTHA
ncbi:hypothetical protein C8R46DRAFT_1191863, partial [Mycena filopes]